jgi:hypothetical protein
MTVQDGPGLSPWARREEPPPPAPGRGRTAWILDAVRYGLPAVILVAGLVVIVSGDGDSTALEAGFMFIGAAIAVLLLNLFFRIGVKGDVERDREDEARRFFDRHGRWPGEE